jgi:hypothetical protein
VEAKLRETPDDEPRHGMVRLLDDLRQQQNTSEVTARDTLSTAQRLLQRSASQGDPADRANRDRLQHWLQDMRASRDTTANPLQDPRPQPQPESGRDDLPTRQEVLALRRAVDGLRQEIRLLREALQRDAQPEPTRGRAVPPGPAGPTRRTPQPLQPGPAGSSRGVQPPAHAVPPDAPGPSGPARAPRALPPSGRAPETLPREPAPAAPNASRRARRAPGTDSQPEPADVPEPLPPTPPQVPPVANPDRGRVS